MIAVLDLSSNYGGLRIGIATSFFILAVLSRLQGYQVWALLLALFAILFNPIAPPDLSRALWHWADVGGIVALVFFAFEVTDP